MVSSEQQNWGHVLRSHANHESNVMVRFVARLKKPVCSRHWTVAADNCSSRYSRRQNSRADAAGSTCRRKRIYSSDVGAGSRFVVQAPRRRAGNTPASHGRCARLVHRVVVAPHLVERDRHASKSACIKRSHLLPAVVFSGASRSFCQS